MYTFTRWLCGGCRQRKTTAASRSAATDAVKSPGNKPVAKRPPNAKYKTILSIDGGGLRDIIPVMVLIELEKAIKEHVLQRKEHFFTNEEVNAIKTENDFVVYLADYFDLVAGTSAGSMVATYIASKGKGSGKITKGHKKLRPGSMEVMRVAFFNYGKVLFPPSPCKWLQMILMLFKSKYASKDQKNFLDLIVKGQKFSDLDTDLLVTSYDIQINKGHTFTRIKPAEGAEAQTFVVETSVRTTPLLAAMERTASCEKPGDCSDYRRSETKVDLLLADVSQASSSAPTIFPPTLLEVKDLCKTFRLVDGATIASNPTLEAVTISHELSTAYSLETVAVFSLGTGVQYPANNSFPSSPGIYWWMVRDPYLLDIVTEGSAEYVQNVLRTWLKNEFHFEDNQYSRFQIEGTKETYPILSSVDDLSQLPNLQKLGKKLADENAENIRIFVKKYIFGEESQ